MRTVIVDPRLNVRVSKISAISGMGVRGHLMLRTGWPPVTPMGM
jgi:hypothetical protein